MNYAQGDISGRYAKEKINLLGPKSKMSIDDQTFGLVKSAKNIITSDKKITSNGILGLAFPALTANSDKVEAYQPFVFNLYAKKLISQPVFSISLTDRQGWNSELTLGGIHHEKYAGDLHYVPVTKNLDKKTLKQDYTFWSVQLNQIHLNDTAKISIDKSVLLDTGTTLSYLEKNTVEQIIQSVTQLRFDQDLELYTVDCALKSSDKKVEFAFASGKKESLVKLSVPFKELISKNEDGKCTFDITHSYDDVDTLVLGDTILKSAYFVFDMEKKQVAMATSIYTETKVWV